jgi:SAM-dependent methyltransferase
VATLAAAVVADPDVLAFYAQGLERGRLSGTPEFRLELLRTQAILRGVLPPAPARVLDVGGGPGAHGRWLAEDGYDVLVIDPVPLHVEQARAAGLAAEEGDARSLATQDASADAVLALGPLYHLPERADRLRALAEARRVLRPGGLLAAAGISRFASTLDGLRTGWLADPAFRANVAGVLETGVHRNPDRVPEWFTTASFQRPDELRAEVAEAGFEDVRVVGVEGAAWLLGDLAGWLDDDARRPLLLDFLARIEAEPSLLGASAHLLALAHSSSSG